MSAAEHGKIDPATVADLYVRYGAELQRFLVGLLRDWQLAADAAPGDVRQTGRVWAQHPGRFPQGLAVPGGLPRGHAAASPPSRRRRRTAPHRVGPRVGRRVGRQPRWSESETVERVRQAISELSAEQQQVVRMRIYEEKTFAVIAAELGIPLGTALGRMRAAMSKLRTKLDEQR